MAQDKAETADELILQQILCSVDENAQISQRQLSSELGIALGSVNWYLKRCINKGLIKIQQVPLKRYVYYLTPNGFEEKSRLTAQYLRTSLNFFRKGREQAEAILSECVRTGKPHIILAGDGDLAEIFILSGVEVPVIIHAICDPDSKHKNRLRIPIVKSIKQAETYLKDLDSAVCVLTDFTSPQKSYEALISMGVEQEQIVIPDLLRFKPSARRLD